MKTFSDMHFLSVIRNSDKIPKKTAGGRHKWVYHCHLRKNWWLACVIGKEEVDEIKESFLHPVDTLPPFDGTKK